MGQMPSMRKVESRSIESIGYDPPPQELYVRFLDSDPTYIYSAVEQTLFDELMQAESKGAFINRRIKPNYTFRRQLPRAHR